MFHSYCTLSVSPKLKERDLNTKGSLQWTRVQKQPVNRLDLSDLCFVDDLGQPLDFFLRKSQLSRLAEMVSQVLESGSLRVNKSKLEVLAGAAGRSARRINAEIARRATTVPGATTVVKYLGCQLESQGCRGTNTTVQRAPNAQARYS